MFATTKDVTELNSAQKVFSASEPGTLVEEKTGLHPERGRLAVFWIKCQDWNCCEPLKVRKIQSQIGCLRGTENDNKKLK